MGRCLPDLVLGVAAPVALAAAIGVLDWISGLIVVVAILLFPLFGALIGRATMALARDRWSQVAHLGTQVTDQFEGLATLRAFGRTGEQRRRLAEANESLRRASLSTLRVAFLSALVLDTLASVSVALIAVPLGLRLLQGSVPLPAALAVLLVAPEVFLPLRRASAEFHESTEGLSALGKVFDAAGAPAVGEPPGTPSPDPATVPVTLDHVELVLRGRPEPVLREATLVIAPGETVALVGVNGAGKSSVLSLLLGFFSPTAGTVRVGQHDLAALDIEGWRRQIAFLPERPSILMASLADNLRLGAPDACSEDLVAALGELGAHDLMPLLDEDAPLLEPAGRTLSAGERQRIGLARVLLRPASLYLLDEPTVHLDDAAEASAVAALRRHLGGRSALVVTHRPAVLALADRVVEVREGRLVASSETPSAPSALRRRSPLVAAGSTS